ncbi:hypothetical protein [Rhodosalinus halophilus]|uniref:hypothetical protein n=1 Tax=Rhodosalinus halophilus TaxID=2259333 RepID=UPI0013143C6A|nr:hypothetical protein [Rhodosalinus halophilus]
MPKAPEFTVRADRRFPVRNEDEATVRKAFVQALSRHYDTHAHRYHEEYVNPPGLGLFVEDFPGTRTERLDVPIDTVDPKPIPVPNPFPPDKPGNGGFSGGPRPRPQSIPKGGPIGKPLPLIEEIEVPDVPEHVADYVWHVSRREDDFDFDDIRPVERRTIKGVTRMVGEPWKLKLAIPGPGTYDIRIRQRSDSGRTVFERETTLDLRDFLVVALGDSYSSGQGNPDIPGAPDHDNAWYDVFLPTLGFVVSLSGGMFTAPLAYRFGKEALDAAKDMLAEKWPTIARQQKATIATDPDPVWQEPAAYRSLKCGTALGAGSLENPELGRLVTFLNFARTGSEVFDGLLGPRTSDGLPIDDWIGNMGQVEEMAETLTRAGRTEIDALVISIGVNDLGFATRLTSLVADDSIALLGGVGDDTKNREETLKRAEHLLDSGKIRGALDSLRQALEELPLSIHQVYLLEYPAAIFDRADGKPHPGCEIFGSAFDLDIDQRDAELTRHLGLRLNEVIREAANDFGWVHVGNIDAGFRGHGYCMGEDSFYRTASQSLVLQGDTEGTMHPNGAGHAVVGEQVAQALEQHMVAAARPPEVVRTEIEAWRVAGVDEQWKPVRFGQDYDMPPVVLASLQTFAGSDPSLARVREADTRGFQVRVEEEQAGEPHHNAEEVGFAVLRPGLLRDRQTGEIVGEAGSLSVDQPSADLWRTLTFDERITGDVVVVMQVMSANGHQPVHVRLRDVGEAADGRRQLRFKMEEWRTADGQHFEERIGYLVLKVGEHTLRGAEIFASLVDGVDESWRRSVVFNARPGGTPVVLTQCQTFRGADPVVVRQKNVERDHFDVRLQEDRQGGDHVGESVGFIVVEAA